MCRGPHGKKEKVLDKKEERSGFPRSNESGFEREIIGADGACGEGSEPGI